MMMTGVLAGQRHEIVLQAFAGFDPEMADIAKKFFDRGWIDAGVRSGKASGHLATPPCHRCIPIF